MNMYTVPDFMWYLAHVNVVSCTR